MFLSLTKWMLVLLALPSFALAQAVDVPEDEQGEVQAPIVGKDKAKQYFQGRKRTPTAASRQPAQAAGARVLAIHIGSFFTSQGYKWGKGDQEDIGKLNLGVTYRMGEWVNSLDLSFRMEYTTYDLDEDNAQKLSFVGLFTFPDAASRFPLYFGLGAGPAIFIKQLNKESALALDYQVVAGGRFMNVIENVGFMGEIGLKDHLFLLSDGQFHGVFLNVGVIWEF